MDQPSQTASAKFLSEENFHQLEQNKEFTKAFETIESSPGHIFITGEAGTGKSTLLQYFRHKTQKKVAVLAPTGVAAINIQGVTIHSFFMFRPDITPETVSDIYVIKTKQRIFKSLQAIVIDEVSMVRADLLDCIDAFMRIYGPQPELPFGGVQMIFFGDLYQLPPVVGRQEEGIFRSHYDSPYFFSSKVFQNLKVKVLKLKEIYRQKDKEFISLLNAIRHHKLTPKDIVRLNKQVRYNLPSGDEHLYIYLTTTNQLAETVNQKQLERLEGKSFQYKGTVSGEFEKKVLPTQEELVLKVGAQVMMLRNDPEKRWVNGTIGKINHIIEGLEGKDIIVVKLQGGTTIEVSSHTWEIYQYYFDEELQSLNSRVIGYFTQFPLKLAWAVTIHKAQGLTFDRVIIDLGQGAFAHGQVYVALSRCRTLEGIALRRPIHKGHLLLDAKVTAFLKRIEESDGEFNLN